MLPKRSVTPEQQPRVLNAPQARPEASAADATVDTPAITEADGAAAAAPVLAAVWCCSVGATWTLELHELDRGTALGTLVDWISSGVPTSQPEPEEALARELLADCGLWLYRDSAAGPCTHTRQGVGYVCGDAEVIALAHRVRDVAAEAAAHPVMLAAQWAAAGFRIHAGPAEKRDGQRQGETLRA